MRLVHPRWWERLWYRICYPYEQWRHRVYMSGYEAGYEDCLDKIRDDVFEEPTYYYSHADRMHDIQVDNPSLPGR